MILKKGMSKIFKNLSLRDDQIFTSENLIESANNSPNKLKNLSVGIGKILAKELTKHKEVQWTSLLISEKISQILKNFGFEYPSPVQFLAIPEIIKGNDVIVRAKNGSGKTLSFIIPILEKIKSERNTLQAIIIVPIRELALQIAKICRYLCKELNIKSTPLVGGSDLEDDVMRVSAGVHLLIGTPGRILDLLERNLCKIDLNPIIVLDEADKLLDSVFFESIYQLLSLVPHKRQMCMYSATFPVSTKSFISMNMQDPKQIQVTEEYTIFNLSSFFAKVEKSTKLPCLKSLLASLDIDQCIIYCNKIESVELLAKKIIEMGYSCYFIHSKMLQDERNTVFHNFSKNKCQILVSTDITTRGTDVQGVNIVINFDLPASSESFLHRQGRAGRFGTKGCCVTLIKDQEMEIIESFGKFVGSAILPCSHDSFKSFCKNKSV